MSLFGVDSGRQAHLAGMRVLVVDDEADSREVMARMLASEGVSAHLAGSADEALALISEIRPHLVLSDIGMPVKDGFELIREVRSHPDGTISPTPAIAVTAFTRPEDARRALREGFDDHLAKPVERATLLQRISDVIERKGGMWPVH